MVTVGLPKRFRLGRSFLDERLAMSLLANRRASSLHTAASEATQFQRLRPKLPRCVNTGGRYDWDFMWLKRFGVQDPFIHVVPSGFLCGLPGWPSWGASLRKDSGYGGTCIVR